MLYRLKAGRVNYYLVIAALQVCKTKAAAAVSVHRINNAAAESFQPDRNPTGRKAGLDHTHLAHDFKRICGSVGVRIAVALGQHRRAEQ